MVEIGDLQRQKSETFDFFTFKNVEKILFECLQTLLKNFDFQVIFTQNLGVPKFDVTEFRQFGYIKDMKKIEESILVDLFETRKSCEKNQN